MRSVNGDSNAVLPWHVIRQEDNGSRYRVGSYATHSEAQQTAERLGKGGEEAVGAYLVERMDRGSGRRS